MSEQPTALRLADALDNCGLIVDDEIRDQAADELRRLHEANQELLEALKPALENICAAKLCEFNSMSSRHEMIRLMDAAITAIGEALAEQPAQQEPSVAAAWQQGYDQGVADERTSEANIGIAGFDAKVNPARNNPYSAEQPAQQEPKKDLMYSTVAMQERHAAFVDRAVATLEQAKREALAEQPAQQQGILARKWILHGGFADVVSFDAEGFPSFYWKESVAKFKAGELSAPCKGKNCGSLNGWLHSAECRAEHEAQYTAPQPAQRKPLTDDPLQGAVDWLLEADGEYFCTATVQRTLRIGYNRAKRLCDTAKERAAHGIKGQA